MHKTLNFVLAHPLRVTFYAALRHGAPRVSAHSGDARCADAGSQAGFARLVEKARLRPAWQSGR